MRRTALCGMRVALTILLGAAVAGCPFPDDDVSLNVSVEKLDFGRNADELTFTVSKSASSDPMGPIVVTASESWLLPQACTDAEEGCTSTGPLDPMTITVRVDRSKTQLGTDTGILTIAASGATNKTVKVYVEDLIEVDFYASEQGPEVGQVVTFYDQSRVAESLGAVTSRLWDFGDGATSTAAQPQHVYTQGGVYPVSLTVRAGNREQTLLREGFMNVGGTAPTAAFSYAPTAIYQGDTTQFTDLSTSVTGAITDWAWDFGDGNSSTEQNPAHVYASPGTYEVTLTVSTPAASDSTALDLLVGSRVPPLARFSVSPNKPDSGKTAQFTDLSRAGSASITAWAWDFGDGGSSTNQNPTHVYATPGYYNVTLTVTTVHGADSAVMADVEVRPPAPVANFRASNIEPSTSEVVQFTDLSSSAGAPIVQWVWNFGDGFTSSQQNPTHIYQTPGTYDVSLTIFTNQATNNSDVEKKLAYVTAADAGDGNISILREFVNRQDGYYSWNYLKSYDKIGAFIHVFDMRSQAWRTPADVAEGRVWRHYLTIIEPDIMPYKTALLFVNGGSFYSEEPNEDNIDDFFVNFAMASGSPVAVIQNVPGQPITFSDEVAIREGRTEDSIIAYTYDRYMKSFDAGSPDTDWPLLFPMTKAAVRAMDTVQQALPYVSKKAVGDAEVEDFIVAGASKRGWTTWLTGAVDSRVRAIVPIVIDVLNMDKQMAHHFSSYGYWSTAIYPYAQERVFDRFDTPAGQALLRMVDPYEYRGELQMPKLILNSTGDQFFLPDSSQFYFKEMLGENHLCYVPNTDHSLDGSVDLFTGSGSVSALNAVLAFFLSVVQEVPRPSITWDFEEDGTIVVESSELPTAAYLFQTYNADGRDFRKDTIGEAWVPKVLTWDSKGRIEVLPEEYPGAWNAAYVIVAFDNEAELARTITVEDSSGDESTLDEAPDFVFSTPIRVRPDNYPTFDGVKNRVSAGTFTQPVFLDYVLLHGTSYKLGYEHGRLFSSEIQEFLPRYVAAAISENSLITADYLDSIWEDGTSGSDPTIDAEIVEEIQGIADGAEVDVELVQRANMVQFAECYEGHSNALWGPATEDYALYQSFSQDQNLRRITQMYPLITVKIPALGKGVPYTNFTYAGIVLAPIGINLSGITVAALGNPLETYVPGTDHFLPLFHNILTGTTNLRDALSLVYETNLGQGHTFVIGDGRYEMRGAKVQVVPGSFPYTWFNNDPADEFAPDVLPGVVYGGLNGAAFTRINNAYGLFNVTRMINTTNALSTAGANILNVVVNAATLDLRMSYAQEDTTASLLAYPTLNMQELMP